MNVKKYDYVIVGGGIAGLASAELLSRSGHSVLLLEKGPKLCQEASASHHGWFHFGSLYSIFPDNQTLRTLVGGIEDTIDNYSAFENMNIKIDAQGKLCFPDNGLGWIRDEPLEYIVSARNNADFNMFTFDGLKSYLTKIFFLFTWEIAIKQFISRHQRFHKHNWLGSILASKWIPKAGIGDYSKEIIEKPAYKDIDLENDTHFKIKGYDRPMRSTAIVSDLVRSFLGSGGEIQLDQQVTSIGGTLGEKFVVTKSGQRFETGLVIVAAGKWLGEFEDADEVKVVASPLLVTYPAVTSHHIVRMTPFMEKSINHIHHTINGYTYSVIGGGDYADPNNLDDVNRTIENLKSKARDVFPKFNTAKVSTHYLGFKTEVTTKFKERNYQYIIRDHGVGEISIVPGKFTLAFSLASSLYHHLHGTKPSKTVKMASYDDAAAYVGVSHHGRLVLEKLELN